MRSPEVFDRWLHVLVYAVILLSFSQLVVALSHPGVPATHDSAAHFTYTYLFDRALLQGQIPVRWIEWVRNGHGQPLFSFYQPGLYYLTQITHLVVPSLSRSLMLTVLLAWSAGAWFTFAWLRPLGTLPAAVAAIGFAFSPYLVLDVFVRGAYPELAAIAYAPGVLWGLDRSLTRDRGRDRLALALLLSVMALCHLPSLLIFSPIFAAYALYTALAHRAPPRRVLATVSAGVLALGLAAFYVLPAIVEIRHVRMREMTRDYFDFHQHFVSPGQWFDERWGFGGSVQGSDDQMSFQVGRGQWLAIAAAVLAVTADVCTRLARATPRALSRLAQDGREADASGAPPPPPHHTGLILMWLMVVAVTLFLMTGAAVGVWERVPPLRFLQFPWRLLMAIAVASSALLALLLSRIRNARLRAIAGLVVVLALVWPMHEHLQPSGYHEGTRLDIDRPGFRYADPAQSAAFIESGYHPSGVRRLPEGTIGRWSIAHGEGRVRARTVHDDALALDVETRDGMQLTLNTPYFPGWTIALDGRAIPASVDPELAFMHVTIPAGRHTLDARLTDTPIRRWSEIVSASSLTVFVMLFVMLLVPRWRRFSRREVEPDSIRRVTSA